MSYNPEHDKDFAEDLFGEIQCHVCRHYHDDGNCDAFPGGIPHEILAHEHIHTEPYEGDGGILFEEIV